MKKSIRFTLEQRQQEMYDRSVGVAPKPPVVFASALEPAMLAALAACREANAGTLAALASAIPVAIKHTESIITDGSPEDRTRAADTIFFLMNALQRQERVLAQAATRKEIAAKNRAHHDARKARAVADKEGVILEVARQRRKIQKVLDKATQEVTHGNTPAA
jgi:hypothetical protein